MNSLESCSLPDINHFFLFSFAVLQCVWTTVSMERVASRASVAMTSAWVAARSPGMLAAVWPAGTFNMGTPVWRNVLLDTIFSGAGAVSVFHSVRLVKIGIFMVKSINFKHECIYSKPKHLNIHLKYIIPLFNSGAPQPV